MSCFVDHAHSRPRLTRSLPAAIAVATVLGAPACKPVKTVQDTVQDTVKGAAAQVAALPIISGAFKVPSRNFKPFEFTVIDGMRSPRLEGTFSATGASNDIEVLLLEEAQFLNWQNRLDFKATYASGRITADKLTIDLPADPAKYYVIFSNRFSRFADKGVVANFKLLYERVM